MAESRLTQNALYPEELESAALQASGRLMELGVGPDDAARIAWGLVEYLRTVWGGRPTYIRILRDKSDAAQLGLLDDAGGTLPESDLLADVAEQVEERLVAIGTEPGEARTLSLAVARHMNDYWGGGLLYICKGRHYEISLRDQEIWRRFNGDNHDWLATQYDLTVQCVYRIIKRVGEAERAKRQASLFSAEK